MADDEILKQEHRDLFMFRSAVYLFKHANEVIGTELDDGSRITQTDIDNAVQMLAESFMIPYKFQKDLFKLKEIVHSCLYLNSFGVGVSWAFHEYDDLSTTNLDTFRNTSEKGMELPFTQFVELCLAYVVQEQGQKYIQESSRVYDYYSQLPQADWEEIRGGIKWTQEGYAQDRALEYTQTGEVLCSIAARTGYTFAEQKRKELLAFVAQTAPVTVSGIRNNAEIIPPPLGSHNKRGINDVLQPRDPQKPLQTDLPSPVISHF